MYTYLHVYIFTCIHIYMYYVYISTYIYNNITRASGTTNTMLTFFDEVLQEVVDGYFSFPPVGYCIILHTIFDPMES